MDRTALLTHLGSLNGFLAEVKRSDAVIGA